MTSPDPRDRPDLADAWRYAEEYYGNPEVIADFELAARYRPEVFGGYITLRQAAFEHRRRCLADAAREGADHPRHRDQPDEGESAAGRARQAGDRCGSDPADVAEVASLCIMISGMLSYQESGRHALRAAEERHAERSAEAAR